MSSFSCIVGDEYGVDNTRYIKIYNPDEDPWARNIFFVHAYSDYPLAHYEEKPLLTDPGFIAILDKIGLKQPEVYRAIYNHIVSLGILLPLDEDDELGEDIYPCEIVRLSSYVGDVSGQEAVARSYRTF